MGTHARRATGREGRALQRLGPGLDFSARRWRSAVSCVDHALVMILLRAHTPGLSWLCSCRLCSRILVDAGRAAQLRGERHDLKPAQHAVDTRDVATRVDLLSP